MFDECIKVSFDISKRDFIFRYKSVEFNHCFIIDRLRGVIVYEHCSFSDGLKHISELAALFPNRYELVIEKLLAPEDVPF